MLRIASLSFALLTATAAASANPTFLLGIGYSQNFYFSWWQGPPTALATDGSNAAYILAYTGDTGRLPATSTLAAAAVGSSFILKLAPDEKTIVYLTVLGFRAKAMAIDAMGSAYVVGPDFVAKLNATGSAFVYKFEIGQGLNLASLAVDSTGRAYVAGNTVTAGIRTTPGAFQETIPDGAQHTFVIRLNVAGTAVDYATYLAGNHNDQTSGIALDPSDSAIVAGIAQSTDFPTTPGAYSTAANATTGVGFLARLKPDGSGLVYSTLLGESGPVMGPAVDHDGNASVGANQSLMRFNAAGVLSFSKTVSSISNVAADPAGNLYVKGYDLFAGRQTRNSMFTCAANSPGYLTVLDPAGDILQSTYLPPGLPVLNGLAVGSSAVYLICWPGSV